MPNYLSKGLRVLGSGQRLIHNWVKPHWGLGKCVTPAMAMGYSVRPFAITELLTHRGFSSISL
jgi:hypothetical protein